MIAIITQGVINNFPFVKVIICVKYSMHYLVLKSLEICFQTCIMNCLKILFQDTISRKGNISTQVVKDEGSVQYIISQYKTLFLIPSNETRSSLILT